jgi:hypothetical protein
VTAFPCYGCDQCGAASTDEDPHPDDDHHMHIDSLFRQNESSCFRYIPCDNSVDEDMDFFEQRKQNKARQGQCPFDGECPQKTSLIKGYVPPQEKLPLFFTPTPTNPDACRISMAYAEGSSWHAVECVDRAYTGGFHDDIDWQEEKTESFELTFGCQTGVTGLFETQLADGIVGMMNTPAAYWWQLYEAKKIAAKQFSLCFTKNPHITYEGTGAGAMVLGGTDPRLHLHEMEYAALPYGSVFHVVLEQVYLRMNGGESIVEQQSDKKVIWKTILGDDSSSVEHIEILVDSGSTNSYLAAGHLAPFQAAWKELTGMEYDTTKEYFFDNGTDISETLPTVVLQFQAWQNSSDPNGGSKSIMVAFPPSHYMRYYPSKEAYIPKLGFRTSDWMPVSLGANFMMGKDVLFDVDNKRLGIAESHCDYLSLGYNRFDPSVTAGGSANNNQNDIESADDRTMLLAIIVVGVLVAGAVWGYKRRRNKEQHDEEERVALGENVDFDETEMVATQVMA